MKPSDTPRGVWTVLAPRKLSAVMHRAYGVWLLGVKWSAGWNAISKAAHRGHSLWVRRSE